MSEGQILRIFEVAMNELSKFKVISGDTVCQYPAGFPQFKDYLNKFLLRQYGFPKITQQYLTSLIDGLNQYDQGITGKFKYAHLLASLIQELFNFQNKETYLWT